MGNPADLITNESIIRPEGFYVIGFTNLKSADLFMHFLGFIYSVTLLFNTFIIAIIWIDQRLHIPKYIGVANLAVVDLMCSTSFIPSTIYTILTRDTFVSYNACVTQSFFYHGSVMLESFSLSVLAYDRLIVICFPLRHSSINTPIRMIFILMTVWAFCVSLLMFSALIVNNLSFCDSLTVSNYVCAYGAVIYLACNDNTLQWTAASCLSILLLFGPLTLIIVSYACILRAVFKMKNVKSRYKALGTCTEHLVLVAIFYGPTIVVYMFELFVFRLDQDTKMVNLAIASCIPSCLNPIVYSLATKEIRGKILHVHQKAKVALLGRAVLNAKFAKASVQIFK